MTDGSLLACAWAAGHLLHIAAPEAQNPAWARFCWDDLPLVPPDGRFRYVCSQGKESWLRRICDLARRADEIINACDAAREGELIFAEIIAWCGIDCDAENVRRMWITDTTADGLRRAWTDALPSRRYARLRTAAHARAEADWIWGISGTRMVTLAIANNRPAHTEVRCDVWPIGRVQSPLLALVEDRCREVASFQPETFWRMEAAFSSSNGLPFKAWLIAPKEVRFGHTETHFHRSPEAAEIRRVLLLEAETVWQVQDVREPGSQSPPPLFDLVDLQRSANRLWGWSAKFTLQVAQSLYERDHAISYPRTDSAALPISMRAEITARYLKLWHEWAVSIWPKLAALPAPRALHDGHFDDDKITDHHAIIPTGMVPVMTVPQSDRVRPERTLWELIVIRFLLAWLRPARIVHARRTLLRENHRGAAWRAILEADPVEEPGWLAYEDSMMNTTGIGPPLAQRLSEKALPAAGPTALLRDVQIKLGHTSAPPYYNDDLLLQKMVALGLGTSATRAEIIAGLEEADLIERGTIGGRFVSTRRGAQLISLLRASPGAVFTDPKETESWERQLELVERAREPLNKEQFIANLIDRLRAIKAGFIASTDLGKTAFCPDTGRPITEDDRRWIFPPGSRLADVTCPKIIAGRPMNASDYVQILIGGAKGGGPFDGFVGRRGPFACWLVFNRRKRRFDFRFKARGLGRRNPAGVR